MAKEDKGALTVAPEFIPTAGTGFLEARSLWMDTLLSLDKVRMPLDVPKNNVPWILWELGVCVQ